MQAELDERGIAVFALSKDDVETAAAHGKRDGLTITLLSDPSLDVIRQYGVEHHKALELGGRPSFKTMAIPTTLLVDESGVIRWIDQADDYRVRSNDDRILEAVKSAFGEKLPAPR